MLSVAQQQIQVPEFKEPHYPVSQKPQENLVTKIALDATEMSGLEYSTIQHVGAKKISSKTLPIKIKKNCIDLKYHEKVNEGNPFQKFFIVTQLIKTNKNEFIKEYNEFIDELIQLYEDNKYSKEDFKKLAVFLTTFIQIQILKSCKNKDFKLIAEVFHKSSPILLEIDMDSALCIAKTCMNNVSENNVLTNECDILLEKIYSSQKDSLIEKIRNSSDHLDLKDLITIVFEYLVKINKNSAIDIAYTCINISNNGKQLRNLPALTQFFLEKYAQGNETYQTCIIEAFEPIIKTASTNFNPKIIEDRIVHAKNVNEACRKIKQSFVVLFNLKNFKAASLLLEKCFLYLNLKVQRRLEGIFDLAYSELKENAPEIAYEMIDNNIEIKHYINNK